MYKFIVLEKDDNEFSKISSVLTEVLPVVHSCQKVNSFKDLISDFKLYLDAHVILADTNTISMAELQKLSLLSPFSLPVIVLSDDPREAVMCYDMGIEVDFILKPFENERIGISFFRILKKHFHLLSGKEPNFIFLKTSRSFSKFIFSDIVYIEGYGPNVKIFTEKRMIVVNESISVVEKKLSICHWFIRIHKSFIVNTEKVEAVDTSHFELSSGKRVPFGRKYKAEVEVMINLISS